MEGSRIKEFCGVLRWMLALLGCGVVSRLNDWNAVLSWRKLLWSEISLKMGRLSLFGDPGGPWSLGPNLVVPEFVFTFGPQSLASNL
jgi:hypothetical protein